MWPHLCRRGRNSVGCEGCSAASDSSQGRQRDVCVIRWANDGDTLGTHARVLGSHINSKCQHNCWLSVSPGALTVSLPRSSSCCTRRSTSIRRLLLAVLFYRKRIGTIRFANSQFLVASTGTGTAITTGIFDKFGSVLGSGGGRVTVRPSSVVT